jgi:hypothetical protein
MCLLIVVDHVQDIKIEDTGETFLADVADDFKTLRRCCQISLQGNAKRMWHRKAKGRLEVTLLTVVKISDCVQLEANYRKKMKLV